MTSTNDWPLYRTASTVGTVFGAENWVQDIDKRIAENPAISARGTAIVGESADVNWLVGIISPGSVAMGEVATRYRSSLPQAEAEAIVLDAHREFIPNVIEAWSTTVEEIGETIVVGTAQDAAAAVDKAGEVASNVGDGVAKFAAGGGLKWIVVGVVAYAVIKVVGLFK